MNNAQTLLRQYLKDGRLMQLATVLDGQPLVCSVYYVMDKNLHLYWLSYPTRRHSRAIAQNGMAALTVVVKSDLPVVGIQMEGRASQVMSKTEVIATMTKYVKKYGVGKQFVANFIAHKNKHCLYKFTPEKIVLFDELHFGVDNAQTLEAMANK